MNELFPGIIPLYQRKRERYIDLRAPRYFLMRARAKKQFFGARATETKLKSRAIIMFLKDSGIRISDEATLNV